MPSCSIVRIFLFALLLTGQISSAQAIPPTAGETLSGKPIVLADVLRGKTTVLVAGFSRAGGNGAGDWMKAIHADPALAHANVWEIAMLAGAPGFVRGMIKNGMKKGIAPADQDRFVVLTSDEQQWKTFFEITSDGDPYVIVLDGQCKVLWRTHGPAAQIEQLKGALR